MRTIQFKNFIGQMIQNKTLNVLAGASFILFVLLNTLHYGAFLGGLFFSNTDVWLDIRNLLNSILINLLAAYVFFILIVHIPNIRQREIIKNNLCTRYWDFKKAVISRFLSMADGHYQHGLVEELCDIRKFRTYFQENYRARWYAITNALTGNRIQLSEIMLELAILRDEISFVFNRVEIHDEQVLAFFKNFSTVMYRFEQNDCEDDDIKVLMRFMWQLFAGWSWIEGYSDDDILESLIEKI
jgi:hypothetical protein